jgi:hypothetical protein
MKFAVNSSFLPVSKTLFSSPEKAFCCPAFFVFIDIKRAGIWTADSAFVIH